jgi:L-asparaginase/Glu-tRNA(Gln) amidotransferase subunit D
MAARSTEMNVKKADAVANLERALKVRGREQNQQIIVAITANTTVHSLWLVMVFRYFADTKTWSP